MILDAWASDASKLVACLPPGSQVAEQARHLLNSVEVNSTEVDIDYFRSASSSKSYSVPEGSFLVVNKTLLQTSPTALGEMAIRLPGVAFVAHGDNVPSVLALPVYSFNTPLGNGCVLLHEFKHLTEKAAGLYKPGLPEPFATADLGVRERRAYQLNADILSALDGSDYSHYLASWPVSFQVTEQGGAKYADISFHDQNCPIPASETFAYDMWQEGGMSRQLLQSIGRMGVLEGIAAGLSPQMTDYLAGNIQVGA